MADATVAKTIRDQIGIGVLMSLGASDFVYWTDALQFKARIIDKPRSNRIRVMTVRVKLDADDTYHVTAGYLKNKFDWISFYDQAGIYADQLSEILFAWDRVL